MCGRFAVTTDPALLAEQIDAINEVPAAGALGRNYEGLNYDVPNYNVAPTDNIATVVSRHTDPPKPGDEPARRVRLMRWGLVPPWTKPGPDGSPVAGGPLLINARADKVTTSPAYRAAAEHRRCLVPMDGFYEWRDETGAGAKAGKTPFYLHGDGAMLFAAGLWSVWRPDRRFDPLLSVTIITTAAVGELARIHDRMPLILPENRWDRWLDPDAPVDTALLADPPDVAGIALREVSKLVNSVRNNGPELIAAAEPQPGQAYLF
ncbi:SOS response-associated peptidase [[Mycobacterium] nativiensis]|uniref:Abasic site processing protein n=1 Tax=[Mycobacterium] nativiensis TaxID=2855503 RepID=A0ABU5XWQ7_9MYCO|nr:SOS response-associated peptidase [Mycolicibacter sp. MYC340]MEB3032212.1 SOS response-associated peptidase [Mycolicibacter sp. MYC340]